MQGDHLARQSWITPEPLQIEQIFLENVFEC